MRGRPSKVDYEKLIDLKVEGKSTQEIADALGIGISTVKKGVQDLLSCGRLAGNYTEGFHRPEVPITEGSRIGNAADCAASIDAEDYIAEKHLQVDETLSPASQELSRSCDATAWESLGAEETPKRGKTVAEYLVEEEAKEAAKKAQAREYPMGVMSRKLFWQSRKDDLRRAICEFACEGLVIDPEWVEEYNELVVQCV